VTATEGAVGSRAGLRDRAPRLRTALGTVLGLARVEAWLLLRSLVVLAGLLAGGLVIWVFIHPVEPVWWDASWEIGYGQVVLGMAVLVAAQLAAGRAHRDGVAELYASFPAAAGTRTLAQLAGLAGAVPAALVLIGAGAVTVELLGPVGDPSLAALAGGLLLVIAAGAAGIAIGTRFAHPLAGVLGALAMFVPFLESNNLSGATAWLYPWVKPDQLGSLPGPLAGYPPAGAHAAELAGVAVLAGVVALAVTASGARARGMLGGAGILALAAICLAAAVQLRPLPTAELNHLVAESANPASVQQCSTVDQVRYCLYPGFGRELTAFEAPVSGVLAHLPASSASPASPAGTLTVRQAAPLSADPTLTHGHAQQLRQWSAQLQQAPGAGGNTASAIYLNAGSWPIGSGLADARFDLALAAAEWAVRLPTGSAATVHGGPCVPFGQAREAIAIWLAIQATHPSAGLLQSGLTGPGGGQVGSLVRGVMVTDWNPPGANVTPLVSLGPQTTDTGYLLASAMSRLPVQKVSDVLRSAWPTWVSPHATDAQLAAALGIPMPRVPTLPNPSHPRAGAGFVSAPGGGMPQSPVCGT
jgi:hypothetical protein